MNNKFSFNNIPSSVLSLYLRSFNIYCKLHHFFIPLFKKKHHPKVFCIGYFKTGTNSVRQAFKILGYRTGHLVKNIKKPDENWAEFIKRCNYDAYTDNPIQFLYKTIDEHFPDSKFILTIRDTNSFKNSYFNYFKGTFMEITYDEIDEIVKKYEKHNRDILEYFKGKPNKFLIMNVINGDGWEKLCPFLGKPVLDRPFPHKNKGRYKGE